MSFKYAKGNDFVVEQPRIRNLLKNHSTIRSTSRMFCNEPQLNEDGNDAKSLTVEGFSKGKINNIIK